VELWVLCTAFYKVLHKDLYKVLFWALKLIAIRCPPSEAAAHKVSLLDANKPLLLPLAIKSIVGDECIGALA
jgi:hypothetical protein